MTHTQFITTAIAVSLAVVIAGGLLFFGPAIFTPFQSTSTDSQMALQLNQGTTTDMTMNNGAEGSLEAPQIPQGQLPTQLAAQDLVVGTGAEAKAGSQVTVNYVGMLPDGTVFDASAKHGQPFSFTLGAGQVIKGWDLGVAGMKVGGKRQLIIPPQDGYGAQGAGGVIPPNATLLFTVELLDVK